jgi:hypothetical protein
MIRKAYTNSSNGLVGENCRHCLHNPGVVSSPSIPSEFTPDSMVSMDEIVHSLRAQSCR